jgi:hypothetical protein
LLIITVPVVGSLDTETITAVPSTSNEVRKAFIIGRYSNMTGDGGYITIITANMFVIYKEPTSFAHFPRGTQLEFGMYSAYGHIFKNIQFLYLHVELIV